MYLSALSMASKIALNVSLPSMRSSMELFLEAGNLVSLSKYSSFVSGRVILYLDIGAANFTKELLFQAFISLSVLIYPLNLFLPKTRYNGSAMGGNATSDTTQATAPWEDLTVKPACTAATREKK